MVLVVDTYVFTTSDILLNEESAGVTPAATATVALWVVCSLNVVRQARCFKSVNSVCVRVSQR